jgi:hypothetical protein
MSFALDRRTADCQMRLHKNTTQKIRRQMHLQRKNREDPVDKTQP